MTRKELEQYDSLLAEIIEDGERLRRAEKRFRAREELFGTGFLFGNPLEELRQRQKLRMDAYAEKIEAVECWIDTISDSIIRRAFKLRYLDALPWSAVSQKMGYQNESGARMVCTRFLDDMKV